MDDPLADPHLAAQILGWHPNNPPGSEYTAYIAEHLYRDEDRYSVIGHAFAEANLVGARFDSRTIFPSASSGPQQKSIASPIISGENASCDI
jgi:hypothetical protein